MSETIVGKTLGFGENDSGIIGAKKFFQFIRVCEQTEPENQYLETHLARDKARH